MEGNHTDPPLFPSAHWCHTLKESNKEKKEVENEPGDAQAFITMLSSNGEGIYIRTFMYTNVLET